VHGWAPGAVASVAAPRLQSSQQLLDNFVYQAHVGEVPHLRRKLAHHFSLVLAVGSADGCNRLARHRDDLPTTHLCRKVLQEHVKLGLLAGDKILSVPAPELGDRIAELVDKALHNGE